MLKPENIAIIGGGAIGTAFSKELIIKYPDSKINIFSRKPVNSSINSISHHLIDYDDISSIYSKKLILLTYNTNINTYIFFKNQYKEL